MILRLSLRAARVLLLFSFLAAIFLAYFSIRNARATQAVELNTLAGYEAAVRLEPDSARNWFLLGHFYQTDFDQGDPAAALRALLMARKLDPLSADTLLELATNYADAGKADEALASYRDAERVAPQSADVLWHYGNFLLRQNDIPAAFAKIHKAVQLDPKRSAEAFSRCFRVVPDANTILDQVIPNSLEAHLAIIFDLTSQRELDLAMTVWSRAAATPGTLEMMDIVRLAYALIEHNRAQDAALLWRQAAQKLKQALPPETSGSVLWDGGFESSFAAGGLGWSYQPLMKGVQVQLDTREKHSGAQSLRLSFAGRKNVAFADVCHWTVVNPGASYNFSAWVKTKALTTNEGIRFFLISRPPEKVLTAQTPEIHGDNAWTNISLPWTAPSGTGFVWVCAARNQSDQPDGAIAGTAWLDDVALVPASPEPPAR